MRVVLALRQSPDWQALAEAHRLGHLIDAASYVPSHHVPSFPEHIQQCIARWNASFRVDFFACRSELQQIARATLDAVEGGLVLKREALASGLPDEPFRLLFLDDDDWFAPDTADRIAIVGTEDVSVFPLVRFDAPIWTFVRNLKASSPIIGRPSRFSNRYQTNNYGLHPRLCVPAALADLADHITASESAEQLRLKDVYYDVMVSATNKTPVSASVIARIVDDEAAFRRHVTAFIAALKRLDLPADASWMRNPLQRTTTLFERALGHPQDG